MKLPYVPSILTFCCVVMFSLTKKCNQAGDNTIYCSCLRLSSGSESTRDLPKSTPIANIDHPATALIMTFILYVKLVKLLYIEV